MIAEEHVFETRQALAAALAGDVAAALRKCIEESGKATLAVSGGSTPELFFENLSEAVLPWRLVTVTLVDERQVPETSPRSNARLVRGKLLKAKAAAARFIPLFDNPGAASLTIDIAILGMGLDGHTASFFPRSGRLAEALDPVTPQGVIEIDAPGAGEPRLTFTLSVLLAARHLALHIEGAEKRAVLDAALRDGAVEDMPVRSVLKSEVPVILYWCP